MEKSVSEFTFYMQICFLLVVGGGEGWGCILDLELCSIWVIGYFRSNVH